MIEKINYPEVFRRFIWREKIIEEGRIIININDIASENRERLRKNLLFMQNLEKYLFGFRSVRDGDVKNFTVRVLCGPEEEENYSFWKNLSVSENASSCQYPENDNILVEFENIRVSLGLSYEDNARCIRTASFLKVL